MNNLRRNMEVKPKILLVDDIEVNLILLEEMLEHIDVEFIHVNSGEDALKEVDKHEFAIALIDVQMPNMDGYETVKMMRTKENSKFLPVIFISAIYSNNYYKIKGIKSGAVDFITKPIIPEILIGKVQVFIDLYNQKKELERANLDLERANDELEKANSDLEKANKELSDSIAERQKAEEEIKRSLSEKERLLSEIHHRVKNNMQMVSTMLSLQANYGNKENTAEAFEHSIDRINSMALVHEKLYESKRFGEIELGAYIQELGYELVGAYQGSKRIKLEMSFDSVMLEIDAAITLGLLLNELITNTIKHAFPNRIDGNIGIQLKLHDDHSLLLSIQDDGVGLPVDFETRKRTSLGMQLIEGFVRELNGKMNVKTNGGTTFEIHFKPIKKSR